MVARLVTPATLDELRGRVAHTIAAVGAVDRSCAARARVRLERLTKPPGSLGYLEHIAERVCSIQMALRPTVTRRLVIVCAADHGVAEEGVSAYPSAVTPQMVANFLRGGAAINALAQQAAADVRVIDVGVAGAIPYGGKAARLVSQRIRDGTRNMTREPAMSEIEMLQAILVGVDEAAHAAADGIQMIGLGDMGIGNTTAASAITAALTRRPPVEVTGRGTGVDDVTFVRKVEVVERALRLHAPRADRPLDVLQAVGGLEIAALCGVCLSAAARHLVVITDGFIATAATMIADFLCPLVREYVFAAHLSSEPGHAIQLDQLGLHPLLRLDMRLGEGSGAALAMNVIGAACAVINDMATFESAGVSGRPC